MKLFALLLIGSQLLHILNLRFNLTRDYNTANINSMPRFLLINGYGVGNGIHIVRANVEARTDAIIYILMMLMVL